MLGLISRVAVHIGKVLMQATYQLVVLYSLAGGERSGIGLSQVISYPPQESRARRRIFDYNPVRLPEANTFLLQAREYRTPKARRHATPAEAARFCS